MSKKRVSMWVHPEFRKAARMQAAEKDLGLEDYTRSLAKELEKKNEKQKDGFF